MTDSVGLLRELAALEPPLFLFGSVAEVALLGGELSKSHGDVDVLVPRTELEWRLQQLAVLVSMPSLSTTSRAAACRWCTEARAAASSSS